ncbi:MAG: alpha-2-macroglobulin family protein [Chloroflexota bacterium]
MTNLVVSLRTIAAECGIDTPAVKVLCRETAVYDIRVTNYAGQPVQADLSLALVDFGRTHPQRRQCAAHSRSLCVSLPKQVGGSLFISGEGLEAELPQEGGGRGGGGAASEAALSQAVDDEDRVAAATSPDTAFWRANISTDANGQATVEIPLPDSPTTWRLSSKAVTMEIRSLGKPA